MLTKPLSKRRRAYGRLMRGLMVTCAGLTGALVLFLLVYVMVRGVPNLSWELLSTKPSYLTGRIGILPDILNTLYVVLVHACFSPGAAVESRSTSSGWLTYSFGSFPSGRRSTASRRPMALRPMS